MGSFLMTCCVSGLPIEAGEPVRWFLLVQNPHFDHLAVYPDSRWVPRTWPIKAVYNDYGSIGSWEEGPLLDSILEGFKTDLVELGVGDNQIHDVAVFKGMSFKELLEALWEGRVRVQMSPSLPRLADKPKPDSPEPPPYVPTLKRLNSLLRETCLVDEVHDHLRVRGAGFGNSSGALGVAQELLTKNGFAVVRVAGSGNYADAEELRVFVHPGPSLNKFPRRSVDKDAGAIYRGALQVTQAMIREDVWQKMLRLAALDLVQETGLDLPGLRASAARYVVKRGEGSDREDYNDPTPGFLLRGTTGVYNGLAAHAKRLLSSDLTDEQKSDFANLAAEFQYLTNYLSVIRYTWRPSDPAGPQWGVWSLHREFLSGLVEIAGEAHNRREE